jgi:putative lysine transport system ATP-binding protein
METILDIHDVRKSFGSLEVLKGVDFSVSLGEVVCLIGASGSGKSTLLRCINLLEKPDSGTITVFGENVLAVRNVDAYRAKVGMVFQQFNLFNNMTVLKNCMVAQRRVLQRSEKDASEKAMYYLKKVGMENLRMLPASPSPAARNSVLRLPEPCAWSRSSCCLMSRPAHWIRKWSVKSLMS